MTYHAALYAPVQETPSKLFLVIAALLAVLPPALYVAISYFNAPIFAGAWGLAIMPGWPLALFLAVQGLPNTSEEAPERAAASNSPASLAMQGAAS